MAAQAKSDFTHGRYERFSVLQRIEHIVLLVSFSLLGITGLAQKFAANPVADATLRLFGGIEGTRTVHHVAAVTMALLSAYHIVAVGYRVLVLRARMSMLPGVSDAVEMWNDIKFNLGRTKTPAKFGRYNYGEKMEYWAMVWGTLVMGLTGFLMWNPIATANLMPGEWIPAAKAAHGGEAILAVLAIILWHFYNVHIKTFNKSMFIGHLNEHQMTHEHGRELEAIVHGTAGRKIDPIVLRRRQMMYFPVAAVLLGVMSFAILRFFTFEKTAITTLPPANQVAVLVTATPQATPTRPPTAVPTKAPTAAPTATSASPAAAPTTAPASGASFVQVQTILKTKCGTCHGDGAMGGLNVTTYAALMKGGASGPVVVAKDADGSPLIKKTAAGHPAQFAADELTVVKAWIAAGATEAASGAAPAPAATSAAPGGGKQLTLPHAVAGRENCLMCHNPTGGPRPAPKDHVGRANETCLACHKPPDGGSTAAPASATATPSAAGGGPSAGGFSHPVAGRENCLMCHNPEGGVKPAPKDHVGRANETCQACHKPK